MTVSDADVGSNKSVSMKSTKLQDGSNGKASNYELVSGTFSIAKKQITAKLSKVYDGSKEVLNTALESVTGLVGKEQLALSGSANISDANAGSSKTIASHDLSLSDSSEKGASGKASNYELKTIVIEVAKRNLEIVGEKIYDASVAVKDSIFTKISGLVGNEDISVSGTVSLTKADAGDHSISKDSLTLKDGKSGLAANYSINSAGVTVKKKAIKLSGSRKINRINRNYKLASGQLRLGNQLKGDEVKLSGSTNVRVTKEGLNKIGTSGLKLSGKDASNYTLSGETHEFLFELRAKFKALKNIENKINELAKSGKKIITGATQAVPKVVAMSSSPSAGPTTGPSMGGGPTGGGGPSGGGASAAGGGSSGGGSGSGGDSSGGDSSTEE